MAKCGSCTAYHSIDRSTRSTAAGYLSAALETAYKHAGNRLAYESHVRKPGNAETKIKGSHVKRDLRDADTGYDHVERTSDRTGKTSMYHALPNEYRKRLNRRELKFNSSAYKIRDQVEASFDAVKKTYSENLGWAPSLDDPITIFQGEIQQPKYSIYDRKHKRIRTIEVPSVLGFYNPEENYIVIDSGLNPENRERHEYFRRFGIEQSIGAVAAHETIHGLQKRIFGDMSYLTPLQRNYVEGQATEETEKAGYSMKGSYIQQKRNYRKLKDERGVKVLTQLPSNEELRKLQRAA